MKVAGSRVLVTGADGFIGSHLTEMLVEAGADVRAFCYYNSFGSWGWLDSAPQSVRESLHVFLGDVRDPHGVATAMRDIDVVFHLAALVGIPFSYHSPDSYVDTNIKGTLNVVQAARDLEVPRTIVTSTSEVYGTAQYVPIDEKHPRQPQSPYSATKIGADAIAESFYRAFDLPVVIARPFNTYGPRQSARAVIPTIITQALDGALEIKLGSLAPTRDLTYVADTCRAFVALAECDAAVGRDINMGVGSEVSVGDLAQKILELTGSTAHIVTDEARLRPEKSEVERLLSDNSLLRELAGWEPEVDLDAGLSRTVEWFREPTNRAGYKSGIYNV